jgi:hypothetical protein
LRFSLAIGEDESVDGGEDGGKDGKEVRLVREYVRLRVEDMQVGVGIVYTSYK